MGGASGDCERCWTIVPHLYLVLQLAGDPEEFHTEAGIPCGSVSGFTVRSRSHTATFDPSIARQPAAGSAIRDTRAKYYVALRMSLGRSVGMMIGANPSTLAAMARTLNEEKENLLRLHDGTLNANLDLPDSLRGLDLRSRYRRRARRFEAIARRTGELWPRDVWPPDRLLLGTWTGGSVGPYLRNLAVLRRNHRPRSGLGEGRTTLPLSDDTSAGVLDVTTHYFEFIPEAEGDSPNPTVLGAHELDEGKHYYILLTTAAGLYRYHIHDLVRVVGFHGRAPLLEFLAL